MKIKGFIDYYPGKSCFVYPVFFEKERLMIIDEKGEFISFELGGKSEQFTFIDYEVKRNDIDDYRNVFAFKQRKNDILLGSSKELAEYLILSYSNMKNDLELYEEIAYFCRTANLRLEDYTKLSVIERGSRVRQLEEKLGVRNRTFLSDGSSNYLYHSFLNEREIEIKDFSKKVKSRKLLREKRKRRFFDIYNSIEKRL